jgi:hypothetical protein
MPTPEVDPTQNAEFDPERVLLDEEFVVDLDEAVSRLTSFSGDKFTWTEILCHFGLAMCVPLLIQIILGLINRTGGYDVLQYGPCEKLLGWKCPRTVSGCEGMFPSL